MPAAVKTDVTELPESRVRLRLEVPPAEVERRLQGKARELARNLRMPGFRRGKVPPQLVIRRVGRDAVLEEAVREMIPAWYADALQEAGVVPVGDPDVELSGMPPEGEALTFSIEIGVVPKARLGRYKGLTVGRREASVDEAQVEAEIEAMRERLARLETAERAAEAGDFLVLDYDGAPSGGEGEEAQEELSDGDADALKEALSGRDQLLELRPGNLLPGFEEALTGARAGDTRTVEASFPEDYSQPLLAGRQAAMTVTVKEVKRKELPALDDELAVDAGFDSLEELREDIRTRLAEAEGTRVEAEFREAALDAAVAEAEIQIPDHLVEARAREMWERMIHSLGHRGISRETYLRLDGRDEKDLVAELEPDARRALGREAVVTAVVEQEKIEPADAEIEQLLESAAAERSVPTSQLLEEVRRSGQLDELREQLAAKAAVDVIVKHAEPISPELAAARERLWTPGDSDESKGGAEGERAAGDGPERAEGGSGGQGDRLWTPGR